jgi:type II secretory pathway component PulF
MRFQATILDADGATEQVVVDAPDEVALHERLQSEGRTLLRVQSSDAVHGERRNLHVRLSPRRLLLMTQAFYEALDAGVPLLSTFQAIAEQEEDENTTSLLIDLGDRIAAGQAFSDALAAHPQAFPGIYCSLVRAGEQSGSLPQVLNSITGFLEWRIEIASTVRQAMVYPLIVAIAGYAMVLFLMSFVIPRLGSVLSKISTELPAASRILIGASDFVANHILGIVLTSIGGFVALAFALRSPAVKGASLTLLAGLPVVHRVVETLAIAQFARTFSVLLNAGLTMTNALTLGSGAVSLPSLAERIAAARDRIIGGARLGEALEAEEVLPPVALSMVRVGEEAGRLPITFERLGRLYDREVKDAVKKALGLLEPVVTVLLGVVVGGVAVLVVMTIYSAMKGIGR